MGPMPRVYCEVSRDNGRYGFDFFTTGPPCGVLIMPGMPPLNGSKKRGQPQERRLTQVSGE